MNQDKQSGEQPAVNETPQKTTKQPTVAMTEEMAKAELQKWMTATKIRQSKQRRLEQEIKVLVGAIEDGDLVINDDRTLEYKLIWPVENTEGGKELEKLKFRWRIATQEIHDAVANLTDGNKIITGYIQVLTGQPKPIITKMQPADFSICQAIAGFFLP